MAPGQEYPRGPEAVPRELEVLVVRIAGRRYGVPVSAVREVLPLVEPRPVPAWPDFALGLIDVRGAALPLVDPAPSLGEAPLSLTPSCRVVVLAGPEGATGVVVDEVEGLLRVAPLGLEAIAPASVRPHPPRCTAVFSLGGATVPVLAPQALIAKLADPADPVGEAP